MSEAAVATASFEASVIEVLQHGLGRLGIHATVEVEKVPDLDLYRVFITAPEFENLWASERQEIAWRLLQERFSRDDQFRISSIFPMTPDEIEGKA